jgi:hypothetical protein
VRQMWGIPLPGCDETMQRVPEGRLGLSEWAQVVKNPHGDRTRGHEVIIRNLLLTTRAVFRVQGYIKSCNLGTFGTWNE